MRALGHTVGEYDDLPLADIVNREVWPVVSAAGLAWVLRSHPNWRDHLGLIHPLIFSLAAIEVVLTTDVLYTEGYRLNPALSEQLSKANRRPRADQRQPLALSRRIGCNQAR